MARWSVFYADKSSFSSEDGPPEAAPGLGVISIAQENEVQGERSYIQHMTDYYIWLGTHWLGCDLFRLWQYIFVEKHSFNKVALAGQTIGNSEFLAIDQKAKERRDSYNDPGNL